MPQSADEILDAAQGHHVAGRLAEAAELYQQALKLRPDDHQGWFFLGLAEFQLARPAEAADFVRRAITLDPNIAEYYCDLGKILFHLNDLPGAVSAARKALELRADFPEALFNLGNALCRSELFDEGIDAYRKAIALRGDVPDAINNLGMALLSVCRIDEAVTCFDRALELNSRDAAAHSNRIYARCFQPECDAAAMRRELTAWNQRHATPVHAVLRPQFNGHDLDRPLRIGYVSADFRKHVVGWSFLPLLENHDRARFDIFCYSSVLRPDGMTRKMQSLVPAWRDIFGQTDAQAAEAVRDDRIDILVDLSLHTSGNRLLVFARKPAPIQVTFLGYPGSTGLDAIDYRLSDPFLDSDDDLSDYTEKTIRLPRTYWCYQPGGAAPAVGPLPALSSGMITFGCLNAFQKLSAPTLELWGQMLAARPDSGLLLHGPAGNCRAKLVEVFGRSGIQPRRIEFVGRLPWTRYIQTYQRIDIALDPFPYGGGITTCDALWMGVPVITLRGRTAVGRGGASILSNVNLHHFIGRSAEQYISAATALAQDTALLSEMRNTLRRRMLESPLMDAVKFARDVEGAFLKMWGDWTGSARA